MMRGTSNTPPTFEDIRKLALTAIYSDELLLGTMVLKGGNALSLIHGLTRRTSLDLDFSIPADFDDPTEVCKRLERALQETFAQKGMSVFDVRMEPRPRRAQEGTPDFWGGYQAEFKLIETSKDRAHAELESKRRHSLPVSPGDQKVFRIDISKHEYCEAKEKKLLNSSTIFVYTPSAIIAEKLRAICQQMPEYKHIPLSMKRARANDFYDIHEVYTSHKRTFDNEGPTLVKAVFNAKEVPLEFLGRIHTTKDFHEVGFSILRGTVTSRLQEFQYYFDVVADIAAGLEPLWKVDSPP